MKQERRTESVCVREKGKINGLTGSISKKEKKKARFDRTKRRRTQVSEKESEEGEKRIVSFTCCTITVFALAL